MWGFPLFLAIGSESPSIAKTATTSVPTVCKPYDPKNKTLDLSCYEDRYLEATREEPRILNQNPAAHCGRDALLFSNRILVPDQGQDIYEINPSKDPKAATFRLNCAVPTLWDLANPESAFLENSFLTYLQVKGKTVWVPNYLCDDLGYSGFFIKSTDDFKNLQSLLQQPFDNEEGNIFACYSSKPTGEGNVVQNGEEVKQSAFRLLSEQLFASLGQAAEGALTSPEEGPWDLAGAAFKSSASQIGSMFGKSLQDAGGILKDVTSAKSPFEGNDFFQEGSAVDPESEEGEAPLDPEEEEPAEDDSMFDLDQEG